ncbi:MAG: aminoglycoside phosphotransferase family protein [bacterium]|nr:aminoglycoside phosphotransferase family protein [bacterium]
MSIEGLTHIVSQFQTCGQIVRVEKFGSGLINETYRSIVADGDSTRSYIHQKINKNVFPHPDEVIENMALVTSHIREKLQQDHSGRRKTTLELVPSKDGRLYYIDDDGEYWRTTLFIPDIVAYDTVQNPQHAREAGRILGEFQRFVADIPPGQLHDTLPGYHHTPLYYERFLQNLGSPHPDSGIESRKRDADAIMLIEQFKRRETLVPLLMSAYKNGTLNERVVHNDPKINNILFDAHSHQGVCIIDLDTVKNGLIHFDYGDCLRTVSNPLGEETRNVRDVYFDLKNFESLTEGFLEETRCFLTEDDLEYLVDSIKVIVLEQTVRFFHDYLQGDVYYTPSYPTQNLNRALVQFALLQDLEMKEAEIRKIVRHHMLKHVAS